MFDNKISGKESSFDRNIVINEGISGVEMNTNEPIVE